MSLVLKDRIHETSTTTGTGTLTLLGPPTGFRGFETLADGDTCPYVIVAIDASGVATGQWETGIGTVGGSGSTLARTTVYANSAGNTSPLTLGAGTKAVFVDRVADFSDGGGNPFDQDLNTDDSPTFAGITTEAVGAPDGVGANSGDDLTLAAGDGGADNTGDNNGGGDVAITGGSGHAWAGEVALTGGNVGAAGYSGGSARLVGGFNEAAPYTSATLSVDGGSDTVAGSISLNAGAPSAEQTAAGDITLTLWSKGTGGSVFRVQNQDSGATYLTAGRGGSVDYLKSSLLAGSGTALVLATAAGEFLRSATLEAFGAGLYVGGTVTAATLNLSSVPASDAGLNSGDLYQTAGVLMIKL